MSSSSRWFLTARLVAAISVLAASSAGAAVVYSTSAQYLTGRDPYGAADFGTKVEVYGSTSTLLNDSVGGPLAGTFTFSGAADAAALALKTRAAVTLTDYPLGSFYTVDTPTYDYLPISGSAYATSMDQVVINGANSTYNMDFVYQLSGTAARGEGNYQYYFRPTVSASATLWSPTTGATIGSNGTAFYPDGPYNSTVTFTIQHVPSNTPLNLTQFMQVLLYSADSQYSTDIDPFATDDWDPIHITSQTSLVGIDPYTVSTSADFSHTLTLENVVLRQLDGSPASNAALFSQNGVLYPVQPVPVPSTFGLACACLAPLLVLRRRRSQ